MKFGEIFLCRFPFTSGGTTKVRPSLVLFDIGSDAIVCRVTSVVRSGAFDVSLADWAAAGLAMPSVVRLNRIVTIEKSLLFRRLGVLSQADEDAVRRIWNANMVL